MPDARSQKPKPTFLDLDLDFSPPVFDYFSGSTMNAQKKRAEGSHDHHAQTGQHVG